MASRTITQLVSDLSGDDIAAGGGENIEFAYRGVQYSIDLTATEAAGFDKSIALYVQHAARLGGRRRSIAPSAELRPKDVRAWARSTGLDVPERGRVPQAIVEQYRAAH